MYSLSRLRLLRMVGSKQTCDSKLVENGLASRPEYDACCSHSSEVTCHNASFPRQHPRSDSMKCSRAAELIMSSVPADLSVCSRGRAQPFWRLASCWQVGVGMKFTAQRAHLLRFGWWPLQCTRRYDWSLEARQSRQSASSSDETLRE